jgi:hypothetical protein
MKKQRSVKVGDVVWLKANKKWPRERAKVLGTEKHGTVLLVGLLKHAQVDDEILEITPHQIEKES